MKQTLSDYIYKYYRNNKTDFAKSLGKSKQTVNNYINSGCTVEDGVLRSKPRIEIKLPKVNGEENANDIHKATS